MNHLKVHFNTDLSEEFENPTQARQIALELMRSSRAEELSIAGNIYRILNDKIFSEACFYSIAVTVEQQGAAKLPDSARLRFADWLSSQGEFSFAVEVLELPVAEQYEGARLYHLGKLLFHAKHYEAALENFQKALVLSEPRDDLELTQNIQFAIKVTEQKKRCVKRRPALRLVEKIANLH